MRMCVSLSDVIIEYAFQCSIMHSNIPNSYKLKKSNIPHVNPSHVAWYEPIVNKWWQICLAKSTFRVCSTHNIVTDTISPVNWVIIRNSLSRYLERQIIRWRYSRGICRWNCHYKCNEAMVWSLSNCHLTKYDSLIHSSLMALKRLKILSNRVVQV